MGKGNPATLKVPTSEEARINGAKGGKRSGEVRRERKLLSQIYAELLAKEHNIGGEVKTTGDLMADTVIQIIGRGDAASVSMLKEIREATEGSKLDVDTTMEIKHTFDPEGV